MHEQVHFSEKNTGLNVIQVIHYVCCVCFIKYCACMFLHFPLTIHSLVLGPLLLYCQYTQKWKTSNQLCNQRQNI